MVGSFPDERSALMLVCARVRYVTSNEWSTRRYLDMSRLGETVREANRSSPQGRGGADVFLDGQAASPRLLRYCTGLIQSSDFLILVSL